MSTKIPFSSTHSIFIKILFLFCYAIVQGLEPVAQPCAGYPYPTTVCIRRYGSLLPGGFYRKQINEVGHANTYSSTQMVNDDSFKQVANASFIIWDEQQASAILGSMPQYEFMFQLEEIAHEAPVYVPITQELWFSRLHYNWLVQFVVNLKANPPTLSTRELHPPLYSASGSRYRNGSIFYSAGGGNQSLGTEAFVPGIYRVNPVSGRSEPVVNNYYGWYFNSCDDLDIDSEGNIWFTDNIYSWLDGTRDVPPQLGMATYRFQPQDGQVSIVENSLAQPNGITFSLNGRHVYLSDTGSGSGSIDPYIRPPPPLQYTETGPRTIYKYDVSSDGRIITNKRPIYLSLDYVPDGIKIARNGLLLTAAGHGVDVLTDEGVPLMRIQTNFTAVNIEFVGPNYDELWIVGYGGVARVKWALQGPEYK